MPNRPTLPRLARLLPIVLAAVLAACSSGTPAGTTGTGGSQTLAPAGGSPATGGGGGGGNLCALVTQAEVEAAIGGKIVTTEPDNRDCTWTTSTFSAVNARVESDDTDLEGQHILFPKGRDIPNLGDKAFWGPSGGLIGSVLYIVTKGKTLAVQLVLFNDDDAKNEQIATTIGRLLVSRYNP